MQCFIGNSLSIPSESQETSSTCTELILSSYFVKEYNCLAATRQHFISDSIHHLLISSNNFPFAQTFPYNKGLY